MKILVHTLPFLLSNLKIVKAFLRTFPTKMKPTKCSGKEKRGEERKRKVKFKTAVLLLNSKTISRFCFLHMPN